MTRPRPPAVSQDLFKDWINRMYQVVHQGQKPDFDIEEMTEIGRRVGCMNELPHASLPGTTDRIRREEFFTLVAKTQAVLQAKPQRQ